MWQTLLKKEASFSTYLQDFSTLLKAQMTVQEGLESNTLAGSEFQNVTSELAEIIAAVENTEFGDRQLTGESALEQLEELMETLSVNIHREPSLKELEPSIKKLTEEFDNWMKTQRAGQAKLSRGMNLTLPYYNKTKGKWDKRSVRLPYLTMAKQTITLLETLKDAFENPIVNVDNELEYSSQVYKVVDDLGRGEKFNLFIKPVYNMSPTKGPLSEQFRKVIGGSGRDLKDSIGQGEQSSNMEAEKIMDYEARLLLAERKLMQTLKSKVSNTDEDLYQRIVSMAKRREVDDAFKLRTQAAFDRLFGGESDMSDAEDAVIDQRLSALTAGATLTNEDLMAWRSE